MQFYDHLSIIICASGFLRYNRRMKQSAAKRGKGRPAAGGVWAVDEQACLEIALEAFAEYGFEGASVREISRHSGVSHSLLIARYGSKHALWVAAFDHGMERLHASMSANGSPPGSHASLPDQLRQVCLDFLSGLSECPAIFRIMHSEGSRPGVRLDHIVQKFFHQRSWPFTVILLQGQKEGVFRKVHPIIPFTLLAHGAGALLALSPLMQAIDPRMKPSALPTRKIIEDTATVIVAGLCVDS